jgi:hypothetical protein
MGMLSVRLYSNVKANVKQGISQSTTTPDRKAKSNMNVILLKLLLTELQKRTRPMNQLIQLKLIL